MREAAMPVVKELKELLDKRNVKYVTISHSLAYTAQENAELAHVSGKDIAKTVVVKIDAFSQWLCCPPPATSIFQP
jgi:prolyl-tRNA editing enzyme YbaK/EbsC (Cys-tRNA(Pro) deacylase)